MQFETFTDFINMGGYGFYVWLSYGVSATLLILLILNGKSKHQAIIDKIAKQQTRENKLRKRSQQQTQGLQEQLGE
ncbi:heme exporter protein CcmD [Thalassotalea aquiviva]|uniref:heme exporter protein CcmD n=1 Tax=Thalassotalea aquiviva TaxID=3242415 RepID=UPI00352A33F4